MKKKKLYAVVTKQGNVLLGVFFTNIEAIKKSKEFLNAKVVLCDVVWDKERDK